MRSVRSVLTTQFAGENKRSSVTLPTVRVRCAVASYDTVQVNDFRVCPRMDSRCRSVGTEPRGPQTVSSP